MPQLTEDQQERLALISHKLKFITEKPLVACINSTSDIEHADFYINELIVMAGGKAMLIADGQQAYDAIIEQDPDVLVVLPSEGSAISAMAIIPQLLQQPGFKDVNAVKTNRIYIVDTDIFNDESMSRVDQTELFAEILYPKQFIFGYEGRGWIKFSL